MALSLREKLQKASQASIATNAAKTIAQLDIMEHAPASLPEKSAIDKSATHKATHSTTQQATQRPKRRPTKRPDDPLSDPVSEAAPQSAIHFKDDPASDPVDTPVSDPVNSCGVRLDLWESLTPVQRKVLTYLAMNQGYIIRYAGIAKSCGIPIATAQTACRRFKALSILSSQYGSRGCVKGLRFSLDKKFFDRRKRQDDPVGDPLSDGVSDPLSDGVSRRSTQQATHSATHSPYKEDRQIENLSISSERLALTWPHLARCGFGVEQLDQITTALAELGKPSDKIVQSLDHAEWELARGQMLDKTGQPVADPCSWAFRALAQNGYYRRPKGYISPEEQAARDAEKEARAVIAARQAAEQAQFEAWRSGLSEEELREAMKGYPGGSKDAWLKRVWKERTR